MLPDYYSLSLCISADIDDDYDELRFFYNFLLFFFVCFVMRIVIQGLFFLLCSTPTTKRNIMGFLTDV